MRKFLQGIGIGILLTTLVFTIAYFAVGKRDLTDAQIIARAKKLGMVEKQENIFSDQEDVKSATGENVTVQQNTPASSEQENIDGAGDSQENNQMIETSQRPQENKTDNLENLTDKPENKTSPSENNDELDDDSFQQDENGNISFKIERGEEATQISRRLENAGIVDNAAKFDAYLRENSVSRTIQIGTFELHPDMSYEELAQILSGKR